MDHLVSSLDYKKLFQSLPTAFIVVATDDPVFTILEENEAHATISHAVKSKSIGRPLLEVFPDVSEEYLTTGKSQLLKSIRKVIKTGQPDKIPDLRYDLKDKKGVMKPRYWSVTHYPVIKDKKVIAVYQATEDTTASTLANDNFVTTKYQLEQLLKAGSVGTWMWNVAKKKITGDENTAALFGVEPEALARGIAPTEMNTAVHPDDSERVTKTFRTAMTHFRPYECEYRTIDRDGELHWVIARGYFTNAPEDATLQSPGVIIDITDRKRAEENLNFLTNAMTQFSASLGYKEILGTITKMVVPNIADWCTIDLVEDGELVQVALAHKDPKKVKWAKELRKKQGAPSLDEPDGLAKVIRTGEAEYYPEITREMLEATAKNEEELKLVLELGFSSAIIAPMILDGKTIGALTFVATESRLHYKQADLDVAKSLANRAALAVYNATLYAQATQELEERRELQDSLETLNDELEYRVKERTHELQKTNEGLQQEIRKRKRAEKALDEYSKELARSNQELQDFAYVASHDLQEPLRKIQAFGDLLLSEFGTTLGIDGKEYMNRMRSAASRMSVLIEDLLSFSRVATNAKPLQLVDLNVIASDVLGDLETRMYDTGGTVDLQPLPTVLADETHMRQLFQNLIGNALKFHRKDVAPHVKVYVKPGRTTDKIQTICFEDNGIGFDEKYMDRIFSVFQRLHGKEEYDGTGIGLAVCRKIAERYNGTITAESTKDKGSTFLFSIPVVEKEKKK